MPSTVMISNFRKSTRTPDVYFKGDFQAGLHPSRTSEHNRSDHDSRTQPTAVGQQASDEQKQLYGISVAQCQREKSVEQGDNSNYCPISTTFGHSCVLTWNTHHFIHFRDSRYFFFPSRQVSMLLLWPQVPVSPLPPRPSWLLRRTHPPSDRSLCSSRSSKETLLIFSDAPF